MFQITYWEIQIVDGNTALPQCEWCEERKQDQQGTTRWHPNACTVPSIPKMLLDPNESEADTNFRRFDKSHKVGFPMGGGTNLVALSGCPAKHGEFEATDNYV